MAALIEEISSRTSHSHRTRAEKTSAVDPTNAALLQGLEDLLQAEAGKPVERKTARPVTESFVEGVLSRLGSASLDEASQLIDALREPLADYANSSPEALEKVVTTFFKLFRKEIVANPGDLDHVLSCVGRLLPLNQQSLLVELRKSLPSSGAPKGSDSTDTTDYNSILADMMLLVNKFQVAEIKSQANQDKIQISISDTLVKAATAEAVEVAKKVADALAAQEAASHEPWWKKALGWIAAAVAIVVAAVISIVTCNPLPLIMAVTITAFVMSGGFQAVVSAIGNAIANDLEPGYEAQYIQEGYSKYEAHQLATQKAHAIGDLIGTIVAIVVIMIVSFGVGGITNGAQAAAEGGASLGTEAATVAANVGEEVGETATNIGGRIANLISRLGFSGVNGIKTAITQGVMMLLQSNFIIDSMMINPEWVKEHAKEVSIIQAIAAVVEIVVAILVGRACATGIKAGTQAFSQFAERVATFAPYMFKAQYGVDIAAGAASAAWGGIAYKHNMDAAAFLTTAATLQQDLSTHKSALEMVQQATKTNNTTAENVVQAQAAAMQTLGNASGAVWAAADKVLH